MSLPCPLLALPGAVASSCCTFLSLLELFRFGGSCRCARGISRAPTSCHHLHIRNHRDAVTRGYCQALCYLRPVVVTVSAWGMRDYDIFNSLARPSARVRELRLSLHVAPESFSSDRISSAIHRLPNLSLLSLRVYHAPPPRPDTVSLFERFLLALAVPPIDTPLFATVHIECTYVRRAHPKDSPLSAESIPFPARWTQAMLLLGSRLTSLSLAGYPGWTITGEAIVRLVSACPLLFRLDLQHHVQPDPMEDPADRGNLSGVGNSSTVLYIPSAEENRDAAGQGSSQSLELLVRRGFLPPRIFDIMAAAKEVRHSLIRYTCSLCAFNDSDKGSSLQKTSRAIVGSLAAFPRLTALEMNRASLDGQDICSLLLLLPGLRSLILRHLVWPTVSPSSKYDASSDDSIPLIDLSAVSSSPTPVLLERLELNGDALECFDLIAFSDFLTALDLQSFANGSRSKLLASASATTASLIPNDLVDFLACDHRQPGPLHVRVRTDPRYGVASAQNRVSRYKNVG